MTSASGWGQSGDFRMINSGWGQAPTSSSTGPLGQNMYSNSEPPQHTFAYSTIENYSGPIETWTNYKAISVDEWALFKEHMVVYSDGKNVEGVEAGWLVCMLCTSKKAQSKDLMHSHILSMKHQRNFDWVRSSSRGAEEEERVAPVAYYAPLSLSAEDESLLRQNRCEVVDGWIQCTLCLKKMMDMFFVPEHIRTTKHLNNLEWIRQEEEEGNVNLPNGIESQTFGQYFCTPCGVSMSSRAIMNAHATSVRHLRNTSLLSQKPVAASRSGVAIADLIDFSPDRKTPTRSPPPTRPPPRRPPLVDLIDI